MDVEYFVFYNYEQKVVKRIEIFSENKDSRIREEKSEKKLEPGFRVKRKKKRGKKIGYT